MAKLYEKGDTSDQSEEWDDTELVNAYDRAIKHSRAEVYARIKSSQPFNGCKPLTIEIGGPCRAVYDEDNIEYEATIQSIEDDYVTINFVGYGNLQKVHKSDLLPSYGTEERVKQAEHSYMLKREEKKTKQNVRQYTQTQEVRWPKGISKPMCPPSNPPDHFSMLEGLPIPPPPPVPPHLCKSMKSSEDQQALNAMLMAWYMSGYYTGLYQGRNSKH